MLSDPVGTGHHPSRRDCPVPHPSGPWTLPGIAVPSCFSHVKSINQNVTVRQQSCGFSWAGTWDWRGWECSCSLQSLQGRMGADRFHHSTSLSPGLSGLQLEQRLSLLPWAGIQHSIYSQRPCLTHPGAGPSLSKGKLALSSATRLWRPYGAGRGVGASPDLYCREGSATDPSPCPPGWLFPGRSGCSSLLKKTIKSLSPGFSVSMCSQVS